MPRSARRQSELAQLRHEVVELRSASRQLLQGLTEYARAENWKVEGTLTDDGNEIDRYVWKAGEGPKLARYYLGLEGEKN